MLVLIQFNIVTIFEGISKASLQLCRNTSWEHQYVCSNINLYKAFRCNTCYKNFISTVRLSKDFTYLLSKDLPEDFHIITQYTHLLKIDYLVSFQDGFVLFSSPFQVCVSAYHVILCFLLKLLSYLTDLLIRRIQGILI